MTENISQENQDEVAISRILDKVRKLIAKAEGTDNEAEAKAYQEAADALMLKYALDAAQARKTDPIAARVKPAKMTLFMGKWNEVFWVAQYLAEYVAKHTRCMCSPNITWDRASGEYVLKVYGFQADLKYFEILYTTLRLHMLGVLLPRVDDSKSLGENCVRLHHAGYNWLQIAEMYGWRKCTEAEKIYDAPGVKVPFRHRKTDEIKPATQVGSHFKRAYYAEIKRTGQARIVVQAGTLEAFRLSASQGYLTEIRRRLHAIETGRLAGSDLILKSSMDDVKALYDADHPKREPVVYERCEKCEKAASGVCREHRVRRGRSVAFSEAGYAAGARHAATADLNPAAGSGSKTAIG